MSLRPSLFNLWPSPWPEECKEHDWRFVMPKIMGLKGPVYSCRVCTVEATPTAAGGWEYLHGVEKELPPGTIIELPR